MNNFTQYITEAVGNVADLKKAIKKNGFTVPASFKQEPFTPYKLTYKAKGGYRAEQMIGDVISKLQDAGWMEYDDCEKITPDGSDVSYKSSIVSPDKTVMFVSNTSYGGYSRDNFYLAEFVLVSDLEDELGRAANFKTMKPELTNLGFRYVDPNYYFVDQFTFVSTGAENKNVLNKLESWKSEGENMWSKGNLTAKYEQGSEFWGKLTIKIDANPYKLDF
jgi:hypothetical protein